MINTNLKSHSANKSCLNEDKDLVHLILKDDYITLGSTLDHGVVLGYEESIEEYVQGFLTACLCTKCNSPNVLLSLDGAEVVEVAPRQMGDGLYFVCEVYDNCAKCGADLHVKYLFTEYAYSWFLLKPRTGRTASHMLLTI